ncbi:GroES (chaperonin 10)-like protein [Amanita muscaria]
MSPKKTHSAIASISKGHFDVIQVPTPAPGEGEVLIKVEYAAMIAFDTYINDLAYHSTFPMIFGFNAAGTIEEVGEGVEDLKIGDTMQEYSLQPRTVCAKIPVSISLEAVSTVPDNFITAFNSLFNADNLGLPVPSSFPPTNSPPLSTAPILIYGSGSTAGQYAIQLLHSAGYKNIIATASPKHHSYLRSLGATHTFDYNSPELTQEIATVVNASKSSEGKDGKVDLVMDCITTQTTMATIADIVSPRGKVAVLLPLKMGSKVRSEENDEMFLEIPDRLNPLPEGTKLAGVKTFLYQQDEYLRENLMPRPNKVRLLDESIGTLKDRVAAGLDLLRNNKVSGEKVVVKIN